MSHSVRRRRVQVLLLCFVTASFGQTPPPAAPAASAAAPTHHLPTLDELFSEQQTVGTAISPSGRYVGVIVRRAEDDLLAVYDLQTDEKKVIQRLKFTDAGPKLEMHMKSVFWKTDERLLLRTSVYADEKSRNEPMSIATISKMGERLFALNRDGGELKPLLLGTHSMALAGAFNLGSIMSFLPKDPGHILLTVDGFNGRSLFKVDLATGEGELIEKPGENVVGWWLDVDGTPIVRKTVSNGSVKLYRKDEEGKWRKFYSMRIKEMKERADYEPVGPSDRDDKYYVLARPPGHDRTGLYLYDVEHEQFSEPIVENDTYDLISAQISRDGKTVVRHCYIAHVSICDFSDPKINGHMKGVRRYFEDNANVYVSDSSEDGKTMVLYVEGPHEPPTYFYYLTERQRIEPIGPVQGKLTGLTLPRAEVVRWNARDGKPLTGYLTSPAASAATDRLPLVVYPHGGPELRDHLTFDPWVQAFVARGYGVFQPNFRGSDGFGKSFAESGYGEWGRKMQDDITDGLKALIDKGVVDPARICIVGASYGGYAALAGAALTPELFKCAVSVAGISDLDDFIGWRKRNWGLDSEGYTYWLKAIGNPDTDEEKLRQVSPLRLVNQIKVPVLLIHGTEDDVVPLVQSLAMKKALDKAGHKTDLIKIPGEGHSYWWAEHEKLALSTIDRFLWKNLGPGFGSTTPPPAPSGVPSK